MSHSQVRHDNNWVLARGSKGIILNFNDDSLHVIQVPQLSMRTVEANVSMSDSLGNLIFYSNNCFIANSNHELIENGDELNPGLMQDQWCETSGDPFKQSLLSLPLPKHSGIYYLFHTDLSFFNTPTGSDFAPLHLYYSIVDANSNNGAGKVLEKNTILLEDTLSTGALQAVRHANGRDWWVICPEYKSNCYYKILLNPSGPQLVEKSCIGNILNKLDITGQTLFTQDGTKYIRSDADNGLNIFDFDRCSGELSNPLHISLLPDTNQISGMAISGNSQFVYITFLDKIYQFDLLSSDIAQSKTLVAQWDGAISGGNKTDFYHAKLAPDGKIYICSYGPTFYLHTINQPNKKGIFCEILQHNILLPYSHFASMPNSPNFRLQKESGPCDTIFTITHDAIVKENNNITIFPNPSNNEINIFGNNITVELHAIQVIDLLGRILFSDTIINNSYLLYGKSIGLSNGFYYIITQDINGNKNISKIVIK